MFDFPFSVRLFQSVVIYGQCRMTLLLAFFSFFFLLFFFFFVSLYILIFKKLQWLTPLPTLNIIILMMIL